MKRGRKPLGKIIKRKCIYCKEILPFGEFHKSKGHSGGRTYFCKKCNVEKARERYIKIRLKKCGREKILKEIENLKKGIILRRIILKKEEVKP